MMRNPFEHMVKVCKAYAGESIVSPLPTQSEWYKENMPLVRKGLYQSKATIRPKFKTLKRHYEKKAL